MSAPSYLVFIARQCTATRSRRESAPRVSARQEQNGSWGGTIVMNIKSWAAGLAVACLAACGGGGGSDSPSVTVSAAPSSATLSATTTGAAPSVSVALSATNMPDAGLYVLVHDGAKGYVTAGFAGNAEVLITGTDPGLLAVGTYRDTVALTVCYDQACSRQVSNSPLSVPVTYTVTQGDPATATPSLRAMTPSTVVAGTGGFVLTVTGTNFAPTSVVQWNGMARATTYVSPTSLTAQINASDVASITTAYVLVTNSASGGGTSVGQQFQVTATVPTVTSLSPATAARGGSPYALTVNGTGFDSSVQVTWNGSARTTTYVSATKAVAQVTAADIAASGAFPVAVYNTYGGSVASNAISVTVADAPLALASLAPAFVTAGGPAYVQTVLGTGFSASSTENWNGSPRATTFVSTTQLRVQVTAADIASLGSASVTVVNGGSAPGTSNALGLTLGAPSTHAVAFQINPQHNGAINFANIIPASAFPLALSWTAQLDGTASYPLIAGGRVFLTVARSNGAGSELVALSAATGAVVWGPIALSGAANATYDNGRVIVLSGGFGGAGILTGFDAATGTQLWTTALTSQYMFTAPPTAANGMVYTGGAGSGGTLYAVDDTSGALVWTASVMNGDASSPTVTADGVYVTYPCQTYDFNPQSGALLWNNSTGCEGGGGATGTYGNGVYYSPNQSGYSGMSFDAETGGFLSSYTAGQPPALGSSTGYFLQSGTLSAIDLATNVIGWTFAGDGGLTTAPLLVNGYVFVGSSTGRLYALDAASGAQLWQSALGAAPNTGNWMQLGQSGMTAGDGLLLVPVGSTLTAFTLSSNP